MEHASPEVHPGKAFQQNAEDAFDKIAEEHGLDEHGDEIPVEDDDPVLEAESSEDEPVIEEPEAPALEAEEPEEVQRETSAEPVQDSAVDLPPHTWPQEWKDTFNQMPKEARQITLDMSQKMNAGFTKRMMELSDMRRDMQGVRQSLAPHEERLARAGISPDVAIQRSLAWDAHIQRNPQQGILDMAKAYGVDLGQVTSSQDQQYLTPTERALQEQVNAANSSVHQFQQQMSQWQQHQQSQEMSQRQSNAYQMLDEFMNAKDGKGNQLHPYIEHCAPKMTHYIQTGAAGNLDEAYQMAVAMSPEIQSAQQKQRQADQVKEAKRKAERVRKASSGIVAKGSSKGGKPIRTTEDIVNAAYDKIAHA